MILLAAQLTKNSILISKNKNINDSFDIDEEDNEDIAAEYNIRNIPVTLYVKNGEVLGKYVGSTPANDIYKHIEEYK